MASTVTQQVKHNRFLLGACGRPPERRAPDPHCSLPPWLLLSCFKLRTVPGLPLAHCSCPPDCPWIVPWLLLAPLFLTASSHPSPSLPKATAQPSSQTSGLQKNLPDSLTAKAATSVQHNKSDFGRRAKQAKFSTGIHTWFETPAKTTQVII